MRFPIAIEQGSETTAWGAAVPDLPGCFAAGDNPEEAIANARTAIADWLSMAAVDGVLVPSPRVVDDERKKQFAGWTWTFAEIQLPTITSPSAG